MRYLVGFMLVLALVALPLSVSAQAAEETTTAEPSAEEAVPSSEPTPEKPALELKLDGAGVEVAPTEDWTVWRPFTPEESDAHRRVTRARTGLAVSGGALGAGILFFGLSYAFSYGFCTEEEECEHPATSTPGLFYAGLVMMAGGAAGTIVCGSVYGVRKRKVREMQQAHFRIQRRVQWDLARSRLVF